MCFRSFEAAKDSNFSVRIEKRKRREETGNPEDASSLNRRQKRPKLAHQSSGGPGIQKLKSLLRQTRRLLAKDNLAADVRVGTERRIKSLEADLAKAELAKKERTLAVRYHKVKFFERQKVVRKLKQAKKNLASVSANDPRKKEIESSIFELRLDLNYILHYPKTKKYISLFPPEVRQGGSNSASKLTERETDRAREEVRSWIRGQMQKGELSQEPETYIDSTDPGVKRSKGPRTEAWDARGESRTEAKKSAKTPVSQVEVEEDAFFEDEEDEDEVESSESSDSSDEES